MSLRGLGKKIQSAVMDDVIARLRSDVAEPFGQMAVDRLGDWTRHWRNQPTFGYTVSVTSGAVLDICVTLTIGGTARAKNIFNFVDGGTRPHFITPKKAPVLIFRQFYNRAVTGTKPNYVSTGPASRSGARCVARKVEHPGIHDRDFVGSAVTLAEKVVRERIIAAVQGVILRPYVTIEIVRGGGR